MIGNANAERRALHEALQGIEAAAAVHDAKARPFLEQAKPHQDRAAAVREQADLLLERNGLGEPETHCERCGLPFFKGDVYVSGEDIAGGCPRYFEDSDDQTCYAEDDVNAEIEAQRAREAEARHQADTRRFVVSPPVRGDQRIVVSLYEGGFEIKTRYLRPGTSAHAAATLIAGMATQTRTTAIGVFAQGIGATIADALRSSSMGFEVSELPGAETPRPTEFEEIEGICDLVSDPDTPGPRTPEEAMRRATDRVHKAVYGPSVPEQP